MRALATLFLAAVLPGSALQAQAAPSPAETQVRAVVERCLHGLKFNNTTDFEAALFAGAEGKEEQGALKTLAVDVTDNAASVKVIETYPTSVYVDYLNMLQIAGEWRIVNKIYTSGPNH